MKPKNCSLFVMKLLAMVKLFSISSSCYGCVLERRKMDYFKIKTCHRSDMSQIGLKMVQSLEECIEFARERNGLAFNFSPQEVSKKMILEDRYFSNCQILGCPELANGTTLIPDENFDYYSAFGNMNTTINATCISSTGIFTISHVKENYFNSINNCQKIGADLADVLSESRTKQLANLVNSNVNVWYKASYVGLDDLLNKGIFESSNGNHLHCTRYRAWGPGHPKSHRINENCVTLHSDQTWRVNSCDVQLTAVCEFFPESPTSDEFDEKYLCDKITSKRRKRRCFADRRSFKKLVLESNRTDKCALLNFDKKLSNN